MLLIVASDDPRSPRHGGQLEIRGALEALSRETPTCAIAFTRALHAPTVETLDVEVQPPLEILLVPRRSALRALPRMITGGRPMQVAQRALDKVGQAWAHDFAAAHDPDAILCDGLYAWDLTQWLSGRLGIPAHLREHNVEHRFTRALGRSATSSPERIFFGIDWWLMRRYERRVISSALGTGALFTLSEADARVLGQWAGTRPESVPPFVGNWACGDETAAPSSVQVLLSGNLHTATNLNAAEWFTGQVWPAILQLVPDAELVIAGSRPTGWAQSIASGSPRTVLVADPPEMTPIYRDARCVVNPARAGSGVNIKVLDAIRHGRPVISTRFGARGIPPEGTITATSSDDFAAEVGRLLSDDAYWLEVVRRQAEVVDLEERSRSGASRIVSRIRRGSIQGY